VLPEGSSDTLKVGILPKEKQIGAFADEYNAWLGGTGFATKDSSTFLQEVMLVKDSDGLDLVRKSGQLTTAFEKKLIEEVERIIDEDVQSRHSEISNKIEQVLDNTVQMNIMEKTYNVERNSIDLAYAPIVQSGGRYDLRPTATSDDNVLSYDAILCSVAAKYKGFITNIIRTLFIDPTPVAKNNILPS
jgi:nucleosome binding factor SPN SPT16 subunit